MPRIKPEATGWEARLLPFCYTATLSLAKCMFPLWFFVLVHPLWPPIHPERPASVTHPVSHGREAVLVRVLWQAVQLHLIEEKPQVRGKTPARGCRSTPAAGTSATASQRRISHFDLWSIIIKLQPMFWRKVAGWNLSLSPVIQSQLCPQSYLWMLVQGYLIVKQKWRQI